MRARPNSVGSPYNQCGVDEMVPQATDPACKTSKALIGRLPRQGAFADRPEGWPEDWARGLGLNGRKTRHSQLRPNWGDLLRNRRGVIGAVSSAACQRKIFHKGHAR